MSVDGLNGLGTAPPSVSVRGTESATGLTAATVKATLTVVSGWSGSLEAITRSA